MKKKISTITYVKLAVLIFLYFYLFIYSIYSLFQKGKDLMNPLFGIVVCLAIAAYVLVGKFTKKPNPLDKKVSTIAIVAVILLFIAIIGFIFWYANAIK
ncbi:MAG: hypothetical protein WCV58_04485 [Patescibacteria group bacterium]